MAARLRARGVPVIDADQLARDVVAKGTDGLAEIVQVFGDGVLAPDGSLDRKRLAAEVFNDAEKLRKLNAIVHPRVSAATVARASELGAAGEPLACYDAALLVENGVADAFRPLVVVAAPEDVQIARACARDRTSEGEVRARLRAQMPLSHKVAKADFVIENTGSIDALWRRTDEVLAAICHQLAVDSGRYLSHPPKGA